MLQILISGDEAGLSVVARCRQKEMEKIWTMYYLKLVEILWARKGVIEVINYVRNKWEKVIETNTNINVRLVQAQK